MAGVDSFSIPKEWIPAESWELVEAVRGWAERDVMPVRREIDEDWADHALARRLLHRLCVELGYQQACWPRAYGGLGIDAVTSCLLLEEMSRADSGLATAASCSVWAMSPIFPPHENARLMEHFTPLRNAGMAGDANGDVWFEDVRVPLEFRAHGPGKDAERARAMVVSGNVGTAAQCLGVMKNLYELVKEWCDTRIVAGKPLKEHTITAAVLTDIVTSIEVSRAETYLKARMLDRPDVYGPRDTPEMLARTRVTKLFVSDRLTKVANQALDLMGAYGYAREGDAEKHWRDSKIMSLWMGGRALPQLDIARWFFDAESY